jgi:hypothetical protein
MNLMHLFKKVAIKFPPISRFLRQRDLLIKKNNELEANRWLRHRPVDSFNYILSIGSGAKFDDSKIVGRLMESYQKSNFQVDNGSLWTALFDEHHSSIHQVFMSGNVNEARQILSNPAKSNIFYGFDELTLAYNQIFKDNPKPLLDMCQDDLFRFCEAIGEMPLSNPEAERIVCDASMTSDDLINKIEDGLGIKLDFPDIYPDAVGLSSSRGIVTYRAIQALYLSYRIDNILKLMGRRDGSVCEIGAGLGRSAFYANRLGIKDYTLVDIPITLMTQGYFLMSALGGDAVVLPGEAGRSKGKIKLMLPDEFFSSNENYDLIANVDSLTELGSTLALRYLHDISKKTSIFLSINHEVNTIRVNKLLDVDRLGPFTVSRYPYWMRNGYVEELISFKK